MMPKNFQKENNDYWKKVKPGTIIGRNSRPGKEFFSRLPKGALVLDVGCGDGYVSQMLAKRGYEVTGIDINEKAIKQNKRRNAGIHYKAVDIAKRIPFENDSFDAITFSFVLANVIPFKNRRKAAGEILRVLRPGGIIWANEALISPDYRRRYKISEKTVGEPYSFHVFKDSKIGRLIEDEIDLKKAIRENKVERIAHHFTIGEMTGLFQQCRVVDKKISEVLSPRGRNRTRMIDLLLKKL